MDNDRVTLGASKENSRGVLIGYLLAASVFSKEIFGLPILGSIVDVYQVGLAGVGFLLLGESARPFQILMGWVVVLALSGVLLSLYGYDLGVLAKQGLVAALVYTGFAFLVAKTTSGQLIKAYFNVCFLAAVFGLFQFVLSLGGVAILMKVPGRLDSLAYEPSHYAIAIGPACYLALRALWSERKWFKPRELTILASMLCTVSLTAAMILLASALIIGARQRGPWLALGTILVAFGLYANQELLPEEIQERISAIEGEEATEARGVADITNLSLFSILSNWEVAVDTLKQGRVLGNGFGGHADAYTAHYGDQMLLLDDRFGFNLIAGHSLFIRVFSEMGLLGLLLYLFWIWKGLRWANEPRRLWWTLSAIYLIGRIFKLGGYFEVGMPIFIVAPLVYYGWKDVEPARRRIRARRRARQIKEAAAPGR